MFDFLKDMYLEVNDVEVNKDYKIKNDNRLSRSSKNIFRLASIIYLIFVGFRLYSMIKLDAVDISILKYIILSIIAISIFVLSYIEGKKEKITSIVLFLVFLILNFILAL